MDQQQGTGDSGTGAGDSPVDDATYNLISALHSKLEGIEVLERYAQDDDNGIFQGIAADDRRHVEQLLQALRQRLGGTAGSGGKTGG